LPESALVVVVSTTSPDEVDRVQPREVDDPVISVVETSSTGLLVIVVSTSSLIELVLVLV
jgi:hypothetical protein